MKTDTVDTPGGAVQCPWREGAKVYTDAVGDRMRAGGGPPSLLLGSKKAETVGGKRSEAQPMSGGGGRVRWAKLKIKIKIKLKLKLKLKLELKLKLKLKLKVKLKRKERAGRVGERVA